MSVTFKGKPLIPSKYLEAADLQGKLVAVTIESIVARIELKNPKGEVDYRPMFRLAGKEKGWVLNKTNLKLIAQVYGSKADQWIGKTVVLYATRVESFGKTVDAIRVDVKATEARAANGGAGKKGAPPPADDVEPAHNPETGETTDAGAATEDYSGVGGPAFDEKTDSSGTEG